MAEKKHNRNKRAAALGAAVGLGGSVRHIEARAGSTHRLVRGIHLIPDEVESGALMGLALAGGSASRALQRVVDTIAKHKGLPSEERKLLIRRLRTVDEYLTKANNYGSGGFEVSADIPLVKLTWDEGATRFWAAKRHLEELEHARQFELHARRAGESN